MTTQEKIEVMKAYAEGKKIQYSNKDGKIWMDWPYSIEPSWDWFHQDYRIKPENKYRPYKDTAELKADFFKDCPDMGKRHRLSIWVVSHGGTELEITGFSEKGNYAFTDNAGVRSMEDLFKNFKYLDGTPCGIKED